MDSPFLSDPRHQQWMNVAQELYRRVFAEEAPENIYDWLLRRINSLQPEDTSTGRTLWPESFEIHAAEIARRIEMARLPLVERRLFTWPWTTWNNLLDPAEGGMLTLLAGPDGVGKTTYAECIAEHWANHGHHVVFVHYELSKLVMFDRRAARHTAIARRRMKLADELAPDDLRKLEALRQRLLQWPGAITYEHTPGQSTELVLRKLTDLRAAGLCDVVVVDYLEKAATSAAQLKAYGSNTFAREAADVELLKSWSEQQAVPMLVLSQFNKLGKHSNFGDLDRTMIRGAGEKTEKANVVILLQPDRNAQGVINVRVDKNTLGATGTFKQYLNGPQFQIGDIAS